MNATNTMLCWNPGTSQLQLISWPDKDNLSGNYQMSALACDPDVRKKTFEERKTHIFITAMHIIVRDGCDAKAVHRVLLGLEEYRDGCSDDMPNMPIEY